MHILFLERYATSHQRPLSLWLVVLLNFLLQVLIPSYGLVYYLQHVNAADVPTDLWNFLLWYNSGLLGSMMLGLLYAPVVPFVVALIIIGILFRSDEIRFLFLAATILYNLPIPLLDLSYQEQIYRMTTCLGIILFNLLYFLHPRIRTFYAGNNLR